MCFSVQNETPSAFISTLRNSPWTGHNYMYMYKAKQQSTPKAVTFPRKNELPRVGLEPTTLYTLDRALYQLSYRGSSAGWAQISHLIVHLINRLANHQLSMKEKAHLKTTLHSRQSALPTELPRQLSWLGPNLASHSTPDKQANHQLSMKEKAHFKTCTYARL